MLSDGPVFVTEPESVVGDSGDRVVIRCLVDSHPPAQYSWFKNDKVRQMIIYRMAKFKSTETA